MTKTATCGRINLSQMVGGMYMGIFLKEPNYNNRNSKWVIYIFIIAVISAVIYAGNDSENKDEQVNKIVDENTEKIVTEEEQNSEIKSDIKPVTAGYSFKTNDFNVVVNEIDTDFKGYDDEYGLNTPQSGMKYVMVSFTFKNVGSSDRYVGVDAFHCYADDELCDQVYTLDDKDFFNANLSSGRKVSFNTYYSVPVSAQSIELEYETNILTDEKEIIKIE